MIVRISAEGQYDLDDALHEQLNELDDAVVAAVEAGDEERFHERFQELLSFVRTEGTRHDGEDLSESDFILPPADTSFAEAGEDFTGEGLIPEPA
jgi:hypothetical protein